MIFALIDWLQYKIKKGRYGDIQPDGGMSMAYINHVPDEIISQLNIGDFVFTQRLDSVKSWAMMYMTSSPVDHVAVYCGNGRIAHVTFSGQRIHFLNTVAKGSRVLILRVARSKVERLGSILSEFKARVDERGQLSHALPISLQLAWGALDILLNKYPDRFRFKFLADLLLACAFLDLALFALVGFPVFASAAIALSAVPIWRYFVRWIVPSRHDASLKISHPDEIYFPAISCGGLIFSRLGRIIFCDLGLIPLEVASRIVRQSTDDGTDDDFEESREFFRHLIEDLDLGPSFEQREDHNRNQDD